jgi:hypothetical protein
MILYKDIDFFGLLQFYKKLIFKTHFFQIFFFEAIKSTTYYKNIFK